MGFDDSISILKPYRMNTFNRTAKNHKSRRKGIFLISFIASFSFCLMLFEYANFQNFQSDSLGETLTVEDFMIEQDQFKNLVFELPAQIKKVKKATKIIVSEQIPIQLTIIETIEKINPPEKSLGLYTSKKPNNSNLKIPSKKRIMGFNDISLSNYPYFQDCRNIEDPIEQYKCTQISISNFLLRNTRYPNIPREIGIEGTVIVSFVINKAGIVEDPVILRSVDRQIDLEALRVIQKLPKFEAGTVNGRPINVRFEVPIHFKLAKN